MARRHINEMSPEYIKGKVAAVSLSAQYKNGDLDLVDVEGGAVFKAFRIKGFGGADIAHLHIADAVGAVGGCVVIRRAPLVPEMYDTWREGRVDLEVDGHSAAGGG